MNLLSWRRWSGAEDFGATRNGCAIVNDICIRCPLAFSQGEWPITSLSPTALNSSELEAIGLTIASEAVDGIANHALLQLLTVNKSTSEVEVRFQTREHQQLFLIRLLDFVEEKGNSSLTGVRGSCLSVLRQACVTRNFDIEQSVCPLQNAVLGFEAWLNEPTPLRLWLPTLEINARLIVARRELLFIAGNQSKHNLSRLTGVSQRIADILRKHGHSVQLELIPLALDEFRDQLHEDYFVYYGTWLVEHLTRVRWGIHTYLMPVYRRVYRSPAEGDLAYSYEMPEPISSAVGKEWFWRLMNLVRRGPCIEPLHAPHYLKAAALRPETWVQASVPGV
jgi:hypothetical protein